MTGRHPLALLAAWALMTAPAAHSAPWIFTDPIAITATSGTGIFHHLDASGRRSIAVSDDQLAVVWEDERDGVPHAYIAQKSLAASPFSREQQLSGNGEAFEPTLVALGDGRFAAAWEEDGRVRARLIGPDGLGPIIAVSRSEGVQPSMAFGDGQLLLVSSEREGAYGRIVLQRLAVDAGLTLRPVGHCPVDAEPPRDQQLYPTVAVLAGRAVVLWEDRRPGHTIIMTAEERALGSCQFTPPQRISEDPGGPALPYGAGHGVSRVAVASVAGDQLVAAWADKRNFREGYDIYAATRDKVGSFGINERVQDDFSGLSRQWHTSVAGHPNGLVVVAWDDDREGHSDLYISWRQGEGWSDDLPLPGGSGPGQQTHPSVTLDPAGDLHLAWVERQQPDGTTRLFYLLGRRHQGLP